MAHILLTGATGFVGKQILKLLEAQGHDILLVLRPKWQDRISFDANRTRVLETQDMFAEKSDWWYDALDGIDAVIHSAWYAEPGLYLTSSKNIACIFKIRIRCTRSLPLAQANPHCLSTKTASQITYEPCRPEIPQFPSVLHRRAFCRQRLVDHARPDRLDSMGTNRIGQFCRPDRRPVIIARISNRPFLRGSG